MPDPEISDALKTHPPDPDFVASTRNMLRGAWNAPPPPSNPPSGPMRPGGGGGTGNISRWIASGAAVGLVVVAIVAAVVLGRQSGDSAQDTLPTVAPNGATADGTVVPAATQPVPATPPPVPATPPPPVATPAPTITIATTTSGAPVTTTVPTDGSTAPTTVTQQPTTTAATTTTVITTTTTTPPKTTTTTSAPPKVYVAAKVPKWAIGDTTAPLGQFSRNGVYAASAVGSNDGKAVDLTLAQAFYGQACIDHFGPTAVRVCKQGFGFEYDPDRRSVTAQGATTVIAPFTTSEGRVVLYQIPASEFARLLNGADPHPSAPPGIELFADGLAVGKFQYSDGRIVGVVYDAAYTTPG